jgi:prolyl 4-hydroxylase
MENYIRTYDNVLSPENCASLIEKFEASKDQQKRTELFGHRHFTEINTVEHKDWEPFVKGVFTALSPYIKQYAEDCKIDRVKQWPEKFGFEQIRFKKYEVNDKDEFKEHVDVGDYASARRFLVFFLYLANNEAGQTSFPEYNLSIQPKAGRLLMFPPLWTYKHIAHKPVQTPKYIIGSYLHYL